MLKQKSNWLGIMLCLFLLIGCSNKETPNPDPGSGQLDIQFQTQPVKPTPNQAIKLTASVEEEGKPVTNATVEIEVWKDGEKKHDRLSTKGTEGKYTASKTFTQAGTYQVVVHVTTPKTHQMINPSFTVGTPTQETAHSHNQSAIGLHIMLPKSAQTGESVPLTGHVTQKEKPLSHAQVRFEVWKKGAKEHQFIDAKESKPGEYTTKHVFNTAGEYQIKLHVEKGEHIHAHQEKTLTVTK